MSTIVSTSSSTGRISRLSALLAVVALLGACTASTAPIASRPPSASALAPSAAAVAAAAPLAADRIQILHTNDIHGHLDAQTITTSGRSFELGGMAILGGMIQLQRSRAPARTLTLDAGDALSGTLISAIDHGAAMTKAMSLIGYDAQAVGNHDLDWGQDELAKRAAEASFPFLAANLVQAATGAPPPYVKPYVVKDLGIARVGVIGLTYPSASIIKASSTKGLVFLPGIESVRKYLPEVRRQADVIVVLSHLGVEGGTSRIAGGDTSLAEAVPGIDVIVGGHDHLVFRTARVAGTTKIFQAGTAAEDLGRIELTIDPATHRVSAVQSAGVILPVASGAAPPLASVAALVAERRADADKYGKRVVGKATDAFQADREMNDPLGNLVADALLDYGRRQGWKSDLAFYNGAGLRSSLRAGDITYEELAEVLPFRNTVVSLDLTGAQLTEVFEGMAGSAGRLFMAGGTLAYRSSAAPGSRVTRATVGGQPLDAARTYHVATIDYLQGGGDGHVEFTKGTDLIYGDVDEDVVATYLEAHSPVSPISPGRVTAQ
ncbi:MAG: bifunctional metallophosphatase/5'-nucleotidase [Chloroflexota bacterium]|nr:bifunctional metallophosphatase/5'-nucleotidase [Chloroflexota bacterium]